MAFIREAPMMTTALTLMMGLLATSSHASPPNRPSIETDVCSVLAQPSAFVGKEITLRGFVFLGEDHMNVSDAKCPGHGIELIVDDEATLDQPDIDAFYRKLNKYGRQGFATLTGKFAVVPNTPMPTVLHLHHAKDESPAPKSAP
jgi:hypothetical protein